MRLGSGVVKWISFSKISAVSVSLVRWLRAQSKRIPRLTCPASEANIRAHQVRMVVVIPIRSINRVML